MFILGKVKLLITVVLMLGLAGGVAYVYKLRGDNAILKSNQVKLESAIEDQKEVIASQKADYEKIISINDELNKKINTINQSKKELEKKLAKHDLNYLATEKPKLIERIINKGSDKIMNEMNEATK
jgi:hypothetical protein|tara:strand:+ start:189 stop:566 length:378 start_codon:yes stop_codon:yes gene_type:complete